ncbi:hypothetical protein PG985_013098 [Apiospora marii]|uniref:Uncharacterized protein n=1 Tax=Apiospora marii TaxID=335849 RepID=A0ABR1RCT7_9PEZI
MPRSYKITVINKTGGPQDYAFFNAAPVVSGGMSGPVWSNVIKAADRTPNGGQASFEVATTYYAICGSFEGSPEQGNQVTISKSVPVQLGSSNGGAITLGSSVSLAVYDQSACDLDPPVTPGQGKLGSFQIDTACKPQNQFTLQDAKDSELTPHSYPKPIILDPVASTDPTTTDNLLIGIATSGSSDITKAMASFAPYPNAKYQIMPQAIYHVGVGTRFKVGDIVKAEMLGNTMAVDFNMRGTNNVTLVHAEDMTFYFQ